MSIIRGARNFALVVVLSALPGLGIGKALASSDMINGDIESALKREPEKGRAYHDSLIRNGCVYGGAAITVGIGLGGYFCYSLDAYEKRKRRG